MIIDIYRYFKEHPRYNKLVGGEYLFVEYKCPLNVEEFQLWSPSHVITYVINGRKDWFTAEGTYALHAGDALLTRKGVYTTKQYLEEEYCVMLFFLSDTFIRTFVAEQLPKGTDKDSNTSQREAVPIHSNAEIQVLIQSMFQYLKKGDAIPKELVELKFKELLFNIVLDPGNSAVRQFFHQIHNTTRTNLEDVMSKHFLHELSMADLAKLSGRSLSSFKRDFQAHFNTTPSKWLIAKRLEHAKTLLLGEDLTINEVCHQSGFKNTSHFVRVFKDRYKRTPSQFRSAALLS